MLNGSSCAAGMRPLDLRGVPSSAVKAGDSVCVGSFALSDLRERPIAFLRRLFDTIIEAAEVRRLTFHKLRHTFASLLLSKGKDTAEVSRLLGHSDCAITLKIYIPQNTDDAGAGNQHFVVKEQKGGRVL